MCDFVQKNILDAHKKWFLKNSCLKLNINFVDEEEEVKKGELKEAAKKELEEWYKGHEEQIANNRKSNR